MADRLLHILLVYLIISTITNSYTILNRVLDKIDNQRLIFNRTLTYYSSTFKNCIAVQAVKQLDCPFLGNNTLFHKSVCEQHRLCYACGFVHGVKEQRCNRLSQIYMYELCSEYISSKFDCLKSRYPTLLLLKQDVYRLSEFSFECSNKCVLNYLLNPE